VQKESKNKSQTTTNKWQTGKKPKKKNPIQEKKRLSAGRFYYFSRVDFTLYTLEALLVGILYRVCCLLFMIVFSFSQVMSRISVCCCGQQSRATSYLRLTTFHAILNLKFFTHSFHYVASFQLLQIDPPTPPDSPPENPLLG